MKIYDSKLRKETNYIDGFNLNRDIEYESKLFEKNIDVGCFHPENWDNMIRTYIKKRFTP